MSTNPLNDISRVYLEQVASHEVEEGYQPIDRKKENKMYARAGNLARTAVSSTGKKKEVAQKKSSNIVSAITRQKEKERFDSIGQSPSHNEEAKPDYLDFDKDGNKNEPMKKALKDKKKVEKVEEANDGNLANNYPPYDKVTRGDVIAGATGKDQMGGKKKTVKEGYSNWREDLREVMSKVEKEENDVKITEKKVENKIKTSAMGGGITLPEAIENLGGTLLEMEEIDEKITAKTDMGAAIKDFYTSKSPQLAGRTKEERRKAAIAAVLTARRGGRKRVEEQAMELQPKTQPKTQQKPTSTSSDNIKAIAAAQKAKQAAIALKTKELATLRQTPAGTAVSTFG